MARLGSDVGPAGRTPATAVSRLTQPSLGKCGECEMGSNDALVAEFMVLVVLLDQGHLQQIQASARSTEQCKSGLAPLPTQGA